MKCPTLLACFLCIWVVRESVRCAYTAVWVAMSAEQMISMTYPAQTVVLNQLFLVAWNCQLSSILEYNPSQSDVLIELMVHNITAVHVIWWQSYQPTLQLLPYNEWWWILYDPFACLKECPIAHDEIPGPALKMAHRESQFWKERGKNLSKLMNVWRSSQENPLFLEKKTPH